MSAEDPLRDRYERALLEAFELPDLSSLDATRAIRIVLEPTFAAHDVSLTAWETARDAWLEVRGLPSGARSLALERCGVTLGPAGPVDPAHVDARPRCVELPLGAIENDALWTRLAAVDREALGASSSDGRDGMPVTVTVIDPGGSIATFRTWSPARASAGGEIVRALLDLAIGRVGDAELARALASAAQYLHASR